MALLVIAAILTGAVVIMVVFKITRWWELIVLAGWGICVTAIVYDGTLSSFLGIATGAK